MPKEKIEAIRAGKTVRPPKKWFLKMYHRVKKQYPQYPPKRIAKITAGIWHKYKPKTQVVIVKENPNTEKMLMEMLVEISDKVDEILKKVAGEAK